MSPADLAYERLLDVSGALLLLVILAMLLERALAIIFEYHWFQKLSEKIEGLKTPISKRWKKLWRAQVMRLSL